MCALGIVVGLWRAGGVAVAKGFSLGASGLSYVLWSFIALGHTEMDWYIIYLKAYAHTYARARRRSKDFKPFYRL